jgi:hypothetical protein
MPYAEGDLSLLDLFYDVKDLEGTAYFELHPGELPSNSACWLRGSLFIRDAGFDFFEKCFQQANPAFDYYSFVRFDPGHVARLKEALSTLVGTLESDLPSRTAVFSCYVSLLPAALWDVVELETLCKAVRLTGTGILDFLQKRVGPSTPLWVLGM